MAEASKTSFLGSISPWSRSSTPPLPRSPRQLPKDDALKPSAGLDHSISLRPSPSLKQYPKDCPATKVRWLYAVNAPKRKAFVQETIPEDKERPKPAGPKKYVLFSAADSRAIESAFQALGRDEDTVQETSTRVPVNEDYLYDVHIEKRELEPAYWLGPVYDVIRGSWFYSDGSSLKPCDENLANQLEEGYLKVAPWRRTPGAPRSASQPRSRPSSQVIDGKQSPAATTDAPISNTIRLFGAHMNTIVTYFDATTAYLSADDFMSRMSSSVYGRFGGQSGTRVVRGYVDSAKPTETKSAEQTETKDKRKSVAISESGDVKEPGLQETSDVEQPEPPPPSRPSALERQLSSLAGLSETRTNDEQRQQEEEEARVQAEKEMEDARENYGEEQGRQIDHLVLVTHGIGQRLGLRLDSINFVHDVNTMRKAMKGVFGAAPDLQALTGDSRNCTVQVLPISWRHLLDFPRQSLKNNRKEHDLGDLDPTLDDEYPSLQDITVDGVPAVRNLITDLALDILLYQSAYREHIAKIVRKELNRVYRLFKQRTGFNGSVSLCGHSLGSAVYFDILCRQGEEVKTRPRRVSSRTTREAMAEDSDLQLDFEVESFFALGSPIALFQMLKGRTIAGRQSLRDQAPPTSPFDPDPMRANPFSPNADLGAANTTSSLIPITTSSPKCAEFFNIFHPTDPIAYRVEPLISPAMSQLKAQALPYTKKGLFAAPGIANLSARVGQQVMSGWYNLTSGVASSLINRSLGITGEEQALPQDRGKQFVPSISGNNPSDPSATNILPIADSSKQQAIADAAKTAEPGETPTLIDTEMETLYAGFQKRRRSAVSAGAAEPSGLEYELEQERARRLRREEAKVRALNSNGRIDYSIQEGMFDVSLLASIASHLSYWADEDVNHFMIGQMLKKTKDHDRERDRNKVVL